MKKKSDSYIISQTIILLTYFLPFISCQNLALEDNVVKTLLSISGSGSCHTHIIADETHEEYVSALLSSSNFPLSVKYVNPPVYRIILNLFKIWNTHSSGNFETDIKYFQSSFGFYSQYQNISGLNPFVLNKIRTHNNSFKCLLIVLLLGQNFHNIFHHTAYIKTKRFLVFQDIEVPFSWEVKFKDKLGVFELVNCFSEQLQKNKDLSIGDATKITIMKHYFGGYKIPWGSYFALVKGTFGIFNMKPVTKYVSELLHIYKTTMKIILIKTKAIGPFEKIKKTVLKKLTQDLIVIDNGKCAKGYSKYILNEIYTKINVSLTREQYHLDRPSLLCDPPSDLIYHNS